MIAQPRTAVKTIIILSNDAWVRVPPGADPDAYRREQESRLARPAPTAPVTAPRQEVYL
ncbi:MAG: hypothetical protein KJ077_33725 [Anaerolineae bacterium]|nr:hypothetical protein [Anaerolineae bacterium]